MSKYIIAKAIKIYIYFLLATISFIVDIIFINKKKIKPKFQDPYNNPRIIYIHKGKKYRYKDE